MRSQAGAAQPHLPELSRASRSIIRWTAFSGRRTTTVREFQRLFNLTVDGIIGKATWYRIGYLYTAVKRLAELDSEGIALEEIPQQYPRLLQEGDTGDEVRVIQYYLAVIGDFYNTVPPISVTGTFDQATREAVVAFQNTYGLTPDGMVGQPDLERHVPGLPGNRGILHNL